ncbi:Zinc (Zn2)-Iron (Fe2) Permease (ZIP) Family [Phytophthora nicotianae]|uniref:Zinc (Zn2)-Iron (Fe2) Permease (ZIP) Family n=1 Tax=Phytophthora nicotianae TaxID=4792 RepID=A0A0W8CZ22_PHYNI|nr:Zinc (Zn2)-Iron (Fe2) Permease (ZIP) Family [Phytophthora nicotianae]
MDSVDKFKLAAALFIWALGLIGGIAPLLSSQRVSKRASSILNMVAAGIFLASSCMHLLPDAQNNAALTEWGCEHTAEVFLAVRTRYDGDNKRCFKWANFFYGCGFLMVLLIEVLAHTLQRHYSKVQNGHRQQEHDALLTLDGTRATEAFCSGRLLVDTNHATPAGGVCAAFAGGTFLFVAIMEIIPQELQDPRYQIEKCSALLAGYGAMGVLSLWT